MLNIVLVEPLIPQNTGNIARTCAATGARLHLIEPLGFDISEKAVKRAGLDYWHLVDLHVWPDLPALFEACHPDNLWLATAKAAQSYTDPAVSFKGDCCFSARRPMVCRRSFVRHTPIGAFVFPSVPRHGASTFPILWPSSHTRPCVKTVFPV